MTRRRNPSVRYTVVPVDTDGDEQIDEVFLVRGGKRAAALRQVARLVDDDAMIDMDETRTHPTKHAALAQASRLSPQIRELAGRLARGEN